MAVYTKVSEKELKDFLDDYPLGRLENYSGIAEGIENTNYKLETEAGKYILTLLEKRADPEDLPFFISFMQHLHKNGIACPDVVPMNNGQTIAKLHGKPAIITTFLNGDWPRDITPDHCTAMGDLLARMHDLGRAFPQKRKNAMGISTWQGLIHAVGDQAEEMETDLPEMLDREITYLQNHWPKYLPHGTVHADLFPDNVFFDGKPVSGVIDFYFTATDALVYDLMLTLNAWCFEKGVFIENRAEAFLNAYQHERPLSDVEKDYLSFFGRAAAVRIIATRLYDWFNPVSGATVTPKDPMDHVRILRFHQRQDLPL